MAPSSITDDKPTEPRSTSNKSTTTTISRNFFLAAAIISAGSIPGHILATLALGINIISPQLATARDSVLRLQSADRAARVAFNYVNIGLFISAVLQHRWAQKKEPLTRHDKIIISGMLLGGGIVGLQFWRAKIYPPLGCLWMAPACSVLGWYYA